MFKVKVSKECGCFKKSDFENNQTFESKDEALTTALNMAKIMNQDFCKKHMFRVKEDQEDIIILVEDNNCCDKGHCS